MLQSPILMALPAFLLSTTLSIAGPATPEGAAKLVAVFQTYFGTTADVVTVLPQDDAYQLTLDFAPLLGLLPQDSGAAKITPMVMQLTDQGDGTWAVEQDQALALAVSVPGQMEMAITIGQMTSAGVFDESVAAFSESTTEFTDIALNQTVTDPNAGRTTVSYLIEAGSYQSKASAGAAGGIDSTAKFTASGISEVFSVPGYDATAAPIEIVLKAASYDGEATMSGLRADALYKLVAFFVAHPAAAAIAADQPALKTILTEGVPLFQTIRSTGQISAVEATTPLGVFGLEQVGIDMEMNGIVADGMLREALSFSGLRLPEGVVPEWAKSLIPHSFALDFKASRFDLATPVAMVLAALDLTAAEPIPAALNESLLAALLPDGVVDITLAPGSVISDIYDLRFEGVMSMGPGGTPTGSGKVTATGIAAVQAVLAAAPQDIGGQMVPMLAMAQGLAKAGDDGALAWEIDASQPGTLLINGTDMMAMGGQ